MFRGGKIFGPVHHLFLIYFLFFIFIGLTGVSGLVEEFSALTDVPKA